MILIADTGSSAGGALGALLFLAFMLGCYFLPTIVAYKRHKSNKSAIFLLNLLLGWTVIGWVVSIVWAVTNDEPTTVYIASGNPDEPIRRVNGAAPSPTRFVMHCDSCRHEWVAEKKATSCGACYSTYVKAI